ncbi:uncharacterized protein LOC119463410 [Dermacentor silvarum]|uniref:uncharacterized protein LOC119463410 n=1 Tax=Dermacentor silvarum TaxID=543639 RepID=UPI00189AA541|nr:uncharacterized protein LOC119463410 [Dermacentor silvarum]
MGCWEDMMRAVREMGDPDELANSESLVLLKLEKPLPSDRAIPQQLTANASRSVLTTDQEGLAGCRSFLNKQCYSTVLFAGLPSLRSTKSFLAAAKDIVGKAQELIIVHNRDLVADLMSWFSKVTRLILYHDLMLQMESSDHVREMARASRLCQLWGTTPAVGTEGLFLCPLTLTTLVANCPTLSEIQAPLDEIVKRVDQFRMHSPHPVPLFSECQELTLGSHFQRPNRNAIMMSDASLACIRKALEQYPHLEQLQVTTTSRKVLTCITGFSRLKRINIMYAAQGGMCPFDPYITKMLRALPLTHVTLKYFEGAHLSTIARTCENLECLSLLGCNICDEKIQPGMFSKLKSLEISDSIMDNAFFTLLNVAEGLTNLHLDGEWIISAYVGGPPDISHPRPIHPAMEELTLATDWTLPQLCVVPEEVRRMVESMPALKRLSTDSYDIRLCVQNYYPRVTVAWTTCTTCTAEFPKVDVMQHEIWRIAHCDEEDRE